MYIIWYIRCFFALKLDRTNDSGVSGYSRTFLGIELDQRCLTRDPRHVTRDASVMAYSQGVRDSKKVGHQWIRLILLET
jgi:hypothetical protein